MNPRFLASGLAAALALSPIATEAAEIVPAPPNATDAPIALLVDLSSGQTLFAREENRRFMPASMTKVMTTFLAFEWLSQGKLFREQVTAMRPATFKKWHGVGSTMYLAQNDPVTVDQLLHGITTVSANDGAVVLAEGAAGSVPAWLAAMNAKAAEIGMADSHYGTPNGWMDEGHTFVTARDLATLGAAMITRHPDYYRHFVGMHRMKYNGIEQVNHDPITGVVPGADGIKTGFTNQAGYGFLGSAERDGRRLVMVVAASPTGRQRNNAAKAFIEWGFQAFDSRPIFGKGQVVAQAEVQNGGMRRLDLIAPSGVSVSVPKGTSAKPQLAVRYEGPLRAPVAKGEHVADLIVSMDGRQVSTLPLVADRSIAVATPIQRVINGIAAWLP